MCVGWGLTLAAAQPTIAQTAPDCPTQPHPPPFPLMMPWTDEKKEEGILCLQRGGKKSPGDTARTTVFPRY